MNIFKKIYCRSFQTVFKIALPFLPYRKPKIVSALSDIPSVLNKKKKSCPIIITDPGIAKLGILSMLTDVFDNAGIEYHVYDKTVANPTTDTVEEALAIYKDNKCDCIIGFGGGSSMDCAKAVGVRIARPKTHLSKLGGILKVHAKLPLLVAIPTTAGTGSETTLAAVIVDATTRHKYAINDFPLIPRYAVLDPKVTLTLPASITATTGMDALTHAIEGYTTKAAWEMTDMFHLKAIEIISNSLRGAVDNTPEGREGMALGQYIAGMGFSNVGLGIVHSMAHALGAVYDTPHGVANAILLPTVMEYNAPFTGDKYKYIAKAMGVEGVENMTQEEYRKAAVDAVKKLSSDVGIPANLKEIAKEDDVQFLSESAYADACRPGNPRDTSVEEIAALYRSLM